MAAFLHQRLQEFERVLQSSSAALRAYAELDLELPAVVLTFLDEATDLYHQLGSVDTENEMLARKAEFTAARGGVHPVTLERVISHRREMERSIALRVLLLSADRLRADCAEVRQTLANTRDRLTPLALYAFQKGFLTAAQAGSVTQSELQEIWQSLLNDAESQAAARQVALNTIRADILLILADLFASIE